MKKNKIDLQLTPPYCHRINLAEHAILNFKEHFKYLRAACDPKFPRHLWCRLMQQATLTLNLLWTSLLHPQFSAYHALYGAFDYNQTSLAQFGTSVIIHENPDQRDTWDENVVEGLYLGPHINGHRCYILYVDITGSDNISDTLEIFQKHLPFRSYQHKIRPLMLSNISSLCFATQT